MARNARTRSRTGIYHVMLRGIDKREIFLNKDDYEKFVFYLRKIKEKCDISLLAYCLMPNHVHLLIREGKEDIGDSIRRLAVGYAQYHNVKYARVGHLFQNRFKSEPVQNENYLINVIRYIHQNPLKAGIVKTIAEYTWSSYNDYLKDYNEIVDIEIPIGCFQSLQRFIEYNDQIMNIECLEINSKIRYTDNDLKRIIDSIINKTDIRYMDSVSRNIALRKIKSETGASARQLERVLGIGRNIIMRA